MRGTVIAVNDFYRAFRRSPDGSWTCVAPATLEHPAGRVQVAEGTRLFPGTTFMGIDVAGLLEDELGRSSPAARALGSR